MPTEDPDLAAAAGQVPDTPEGDDPDALSTDELLPEEWTTEFEPPEDEPPEFTDPPTNEDEAANETIDERVQQEQDAPPEEV